MALQGPDGAGKAERVGGCADLIGDDANLVTLGHQPQHGFDEIIALGRIHPGGADDQRRRVMRGGGLLIAASPIMALAALAVRLDSPGPILFRQPREGFNNRSFHCFKFRTMYDERLEYRNITQASRDDPRITRVGRFLRRTSIDELPQLFNVLMGDMSLVGPRPHAASTRAGGRLFSDVVQSYAARHKVKPGITGWAQVCGWRGETDTEEKLIKRFEHDLYYIENWSIWLDLYILVRTVGAVLLPRNAF